MLNMDESSVKLCPWVRKGWVVADRRDRRSVLRRGAGSSLRDRRSAVSLIAFLADSEEVQRLLPQIFLSNERILTQADVEELNASSAQNVVFARRRSSWVNSGTMVEIIEVLAKSLGAFASTHRIVLCMDAFRAHLHSSVIQACNRLGFLLFFIPASMTAWLQPLDLVVFKKYKDWVAQELERKKASAPAGALAKVEVLCAYAEGVRAVLESQPWGRAFDLAGLRGQSKASEELLKRLGCDGPFAISPELPSAADLVAVYPRRASIPVDDLFALALRLSTPQPRVLVLPERARLIAKTRPGPPLLPPASRPRGPAR